LQENIGWRSLEKKILLNKQGKVWTEDWIFKWKWQNDPPEKSTFVTNTLSTLYLMTLWPRASAIKYYGFVMCKMDSRLVGLFVQASVYLQECASLLQNLLTSKSVMLYSTGLCTVSLLKQKSIPRVIDVCV